MTASPYEAQDYLDSGEEIVEAVPAPEGLVAWISAFIQAHHVDEPFKKRKQSRVAVDLREDGRGDARIAQASDVFRAPRRSPDPGESDDRQQSTDGTGEREKRTIH